MNRWNIEELKEMIAKVRDDKADVDLAKEIDKLNKKFINMCEDWNLLVDDEQKVNQNLFYDNQLAYHDAGSLFVQKIMGKQQQSEQPNLSELSKGEEHDNKDVEMVGATGGAIPKQPCAKEHILASNSRIGIPMDTSVITPLKDYRQIFKSIFALKPIESVSELAINAIIVAINEAMALATAIDVPISAQTHFMLIYLEQILDEQTRVLWQWKIDEDPEAHVTMDTMINFLIKRAKRIYPSETSTIPKKSVSAESMDKIGKKQKMICPRCEAEHPLHKCEVFKGLTLHAKWTTVRKNGLCENCFSRLHPTANCRSGECKRCYKKHNSLLCDKLQTNFQ